MQKGIILFDIDRTLLDTDKSLEDHDNEILKVLGSENKNKLQNIRKQYIKSLKNSREYDAEELLSKICRKFNFDNLQKLVDVYLKKENWFIYKNAIYPDVKITLAKLLGDCRLGVFSEALPKFQINKFHAMDLDKYFDPELILILPAKDNLEAIQKIPKGAIVVDDKLTICEFLNKNGVKVVWLNRKDSSVNPDFSTIHSLVELPTLL